MNRKQNPDRTGLGVGLRCGVRAFRGAFAVLALVAWLSGCYTVESAHAPVLGPDAVEHVTVCNYGWTLFGCVPIVCGNAQEDSWCPFTFFQNEIKPEIAWQKLLQRAAEQNCDLRDVNYMDDNDVLFDAYYTAVPWIIVYKECCLSAVLTRRHAAQKEGAR